MECEQKSLLRRHLHAAGSLAQAVADAVSPLAMSQSLQVRKCLACVMLSCMSWRLVQALHSSPSMLAAPPSCIACLLSSTGFGTIICCLAPSTASARNSDGSCGAGHEQGAPWQPLRYRATHRCVPTHSRGQQSACRSKTWCTSRLLLLGLTPTHHACFPACT